MPDLKKLRREYSARIMRLAGVADSRLEAAYAAVPREDFSGPPPWHVAWRGLAGGERDVASLYDDVLVAIDVGRGINNGQPSLHAQCLAALALKAGETVLHIGAGAGYYTAILAHLVGPAGKVVAYEIEPHIAERARQNLAGFPQVEVRAESGVAEGLPQADAVYVNAAASHPVRAWLNALKPGGRLLCPLQAAGSSGAMLLITRPAQESEAWPARVFSRVVFIPCEGAQDVEIGRRLDAAFRRGGSERVRWLRFTRDASGDVWLQGDDWSLTMQREP
jgi:protein-L-isoaspartate(D-aspartate) O-methyltransferase